MTDMAAAHDRTIVRRFGHPPQRPAGYRTPGPDDVFHVEPERKEELFIALAHAAWKRGQGYLIDWLWKIYDESRAEVQKTNWEHNKPKER